MKTAERQARPIAREFSATTPTADLCVRVRVVALMLLQEGADLCPLVERRGGVGCRKDGDGAVDDGVGGWRIAERTVRENRVLRCPPSVSSLRSLQ